MSAPGAQGEVVRPEFRLLVALTSPRRSVERIRTELERCRDWPLVLRSAELNGVLYQLAVVLKTEGQLDLAPPGVAERLAALARRASLLDTIQRAALDEMLDRFGRAGLPAMVLKGLTLADRLYPRSYERIAADIDVLVPAQLRDGAGTLLESLGYEALRRDYYIREHFHIPYTISHGARSLVVELHWGVTKPNSPVVFDVGRWWNSARTLPARSGRILAPPVGEEFVYLAHHAFIEGSISLRDLQDIARLRTTLDDAEDWEAVLSVSERTATTTFVRRALELCERIWGADVGSAPQPGRRSSARRWLARNVLHPATILRAGNFTWWPFKNICYWSMLEPATAPFRELVVRTVRGPRFRQPHGKARRGPIRALRLMLFLSVALFLCSLPIRLFPPQFRQS